jgi:hypothetical protein
MLVVEPRPRRNWHRYSSEQMSGPLPPIMYKYLPSRYAETMVGRGKIMFSTLAWFQNYEDDQRGDRFEGTRKYFPVGGLDVTRIERDGKIHAPVSFKAPTDSLQSRARAHNHIFIDSTSLKNGLVFDDADASVEIYDPAKFAERLRAALKSHRSEKADRLIHDEVKYYDFEAPLTTCGRCRTFSRYTSTVRLQSSTNIGSRSASGGMSSTSSTWIASSCETAKRFRSDGGRPGITAR